MTDRPEPLERVSLTDLCRLTGTNAQTVAYWQTRHGFQLGTLLPGRQNRAYDVVDLAMVLAVTTALPGPAKSCVVMNRQRDRLRRLAEGRARPGERMFVEGMGRGMIMMFWPLAGYVDQARQLLGEQVKAPQ